MTVNVFPIIILRKFLKRLETKIKDTAQSISLNRGIALLGTKGYLLKTLDDSECIIDIRGKLETNKRKDQQRSYIRNLS